VEIMFSQIPGLINSPAVPYKEGFHQQFPIRRGGSQYFPLPLRERARVRGI
jgi:hypothetical protein